MGLRRALLPAYKLWKRAAFWFRELVFGLESANTSLRTADKFIVADILRAHGATVGPEIDMETPLLIHNAVRGYQNLVIGSNCHTGKNVLLDLRNKVQVGDRVTISMGVTIITHTDVGKSRLAEAYSSTSAPVHLGDDCYIGANATILQGVDLGRSCFVGAGSLVNRSFPDCSVIVGVPARVIKTLKLENHGVL